MQFREHIWNIWQELTETQKIVAAGVALLLAIAIAIGGVKTITDHARVRNKEKQAAQAKHEAEAALGMAAVIAKDIKVREDALKQVEVKRDEKQNQVDRAAENTNSDRAAYERAVRDARTDDPSAEQLCRELADLGYPCG